MPREEWEWNEYDEVVERAEEENTCLIAPAYIPLDYINPPRQRIDVYRRLAQADSREALKALREELRDRFGPLPEAMEHLLIVSELKVIAAGKAITSIMCDKNRLKLLRNDEFISLAGKFPRLKKKTAGPRLREVKKLLLAL